jgi:hypothetical protein
LINSIYLKHRLFSENNTVFKYTYKKNEKSLDKKATIQYNCYTRNRSNEGICNHSLTEYKRLKNITGELSRERRLS